MKKAINALFSGLSLVFAVSMLFTFQSCEKNPDDSTKSAMFNGITLKSSVQTDACTKSVCLVAGQHMNVGTVEVGKAQGDLFVTYKITEPGIYLEEIHLDIFTSIEQFGDMKKLSNGGAIPGQFEFKKEWKKSDEMTQWTVVIPQSYIEEIAGNNADCIFIASHAALSNGETAWGGVCEAKDNGVTLDFAKQFEGKNWGVYFEFCMEQCTNLVDFTYAWEDLKKDGPEGNDGDYNDLVVQSDVMKSNTQVVIDFFATARGASYDHAFKFRISKEGILVGDEVGILGAVAVEDDGDDYIVTVFASTKAVLPQEDLSPYLFAANTVSSDDNCLPYGSAQVIILIDNDEFPFDPEFPYDPFITVHPGQSYSYDLNIWELQEDKDNGSTWLDAAGKRFPNGIIISDNWMWPLETININQAYPDFMDIDNWNEDWADNLGDATKVFSVDCDY